MLCSLPLPQRSSGRLVYSTVPSVTRTSTPATLFRLPFPPRYRRVDLERPATSAARTNQRWKKSRYLISKISHVSLSTRARRKCCWQETERGLENSPTSSLRDSPILAPQGPAWVQGGEKTKKDETQHARWSAFRGARRVSYRM